MTCKSFSRLRYLFCSIAFLFSHVLVTVVVVVCLRSVFNDNKNGPFWEPPPPLYSPSIQSTARHSFRLTFSRSRQVRVGLYSKLSISNHSELTFELTIRTSAYVKSPCSCGISGPSKSSPWPTVYWHPLMAFHLIITAAIHMSFRTINLLCWVSYTAKSSTSLRSCLWPTAKTSQIFLKSGSIFRYFFAAEAFHFSPPEMWNSALWEKVL